MKQIPKKYTAYMLRTCNRDMTSHEGFNWKRRGYVEAPDWSDKVECGSGLHGLLWGCGDACYCDISPESIWLVCKIDKRTVVDLVGKIKVPYCSVVFSGDRDSAVSKIMDLGAQDKPVIFARKTGGDKSILNGGDYSTLTGGNHSTLNGGYRSTLTGGYKSTLTGGDHSTLNGGYRSTLTGGNHSTLTGGYNSTLTGGNHSTLTGGNYSTLTGGDYSTLSIKYYDGHRCRIAIGYVGEGLKAGVAYTVDGNGNIIEAKGEV